MEYVECNGLESSLLDCDSSGLGLATCGHFEDAGVICQGTSYSIASFVYKFTSLKVNSHIVDKNTIKSKQY